MVNSIDKKPSSVACFFRESSERCISEAELAHLLGQSSNALGFDHFALVSRRLPGQSRVRLDNYPPAWIERLTIDPPCRLDPVHQASLATNAAFAWDEIGELVSLAPDQRRALSEARRFGLRHGFTVPTNLRGRPPACCSFVARRTVSLTNERRMAAEVIAYHGFAAALRLRRVPNHLPHLSRRERQCIQLVARGKSDWEISRILGISRETVRTYLKQARARHDVVSRTQLVVLALRDGQIDYE